MVGCYIDVITGPGGPKRKFIWSKEIEMSTSRVFNLVVVSALLAVAGLLVQESHATAVVVSDFNSATRSYVAWGKAVEAGRNAVPWKTCPYSDPDNAIEPASNTIDSATRSYIAWGRAIEAKRNAVDSATRSYIAQGKAIEAKRKAIDSATRSYIASGMVLQAQRNTELLCPP